MRSLNTLLSLATIDGINNAVRGPHRVLVRVRVAEHLRSRWLTTYTDDPSAANPASNNVWRVPRFQITSGSVNESIESEIGRELSLTIVSEYWQSLEDVLADISPWKTLISVERGIEAGDSQYYVPLGVYRVTDVSVSGSGGGREVSVEAASLLNDVADYQFITFPITGTYNPGSAVMGTNVGSIIINLIREGFQLTSASVPIRSQGIDDEFDHTFPSKYTLATDRDRLKLVKALEEATSVYGRFNRLNTYEFCPSPDVSEASHWTVDAGRDGVLISYGKEFTRDKVYNAVIVTGENQKTKWVHTHAALSDDFATDWGGSGGFGYKPYFYRSPLLKTVAAVEKTANRMLRDAISSRAGLDFEFVPNPLLEAGDIVTVKLGDGTTEKHLITELSIGLGADASMQAKTKADPGLQSDTLTVLQRAELGGEQIGETMLARPIIRESR